MVELASALTRLAAEKGFSQTALANRVGISTRRMAHYFQGNRSPDYDLLLKIAKVLNADLYELLGLPVPHRGAYGKPTVDDVRRLEGLPSEDEIRALQGLPSEETIRQLRALPSEAEIAAIVGPRHSARGPETEDDLDPEEFTAVPLHDVEIAAGHGAENGFEEVVSHILFRRSWMRAIGVSPADARLAKVRGNSMYPLMSEGDVVMLDSSKREIPIEVKSTTHPRRRSHLYVLEQEGEARVKWVERPDAETLLVYSENIAAFRPEIYTRHDAEMIRLVGRVVWWSHTVSAE